MLAIDKNIIYYSFSDVIVCCLHILWFLADNLNLFITCRSSKRVKILLCSYFGPVLRWILMSQTAQSWGESIQLKNGVSGLLWLSCCAAPRSADVRSLPKHQYACICIPCLLSSRCWWTLRVEQIYISMNPNRCVRNNAWQVNSLLEAMLSLYRKRTSIMKTINSSQNPVC